MNPQTTIPFPGERLKEIGMQMAVEHAESKHRGWSERAYAKLQEYLKINREKFMTEFFREWAERNGLETPPSLRSYGAIIVRASKEGIIKHCGFASVSNYKAHKTPASVWRAI